MSAKGKFALVSNSIPDHIEGSPTSIHAELTILGACLLEPLAYYEAADVLTTADFALMSHRQIFGAMMRLAEDGEPLDLITVGRELERTKEKDSVGGPAYLASLTEGLPRKLSISNYVRIVREKAIYREGMKVCDQFRSKMQSEEGRAMDLLAQMQLALMDLASAGTSGQGKTVAEIVPGVVDKIAKERDNPSTDDALGYTYAIPELDRFTKGAFPNEYTLILAETGGAKTAFLTQILLANALKGIKSKLFSMEMLDEQMVRRMLSSLSEVVTAKDIRDPRFMGIMAFEDLKKTAATLASLGISIDETRQLPLDQFIARAKSAIQRDGVKIIAVDYLQLMQAPSGKGHLNDTQRIEMTTLALRDLAATSKDHGAHVIALSQYSRPADGSKAKATNSRAKGSSSLEQSCQNLFHIIREQNDDGSWSTDVEIRIGKQRDGKFGSIQCVFDENHLKFKGVNA